MSKIVRKRIQTCFERVLGQFFRKNFAQFSMEGRVFENFQKKIQKFAKFQKCPKSFSKVSKHVLNLFWVNFCENFFAQCSMEGRVFENFQKKSKKLQNSKSAKIVLKSIQTCFELVLGQIFRNFFLPNVPWRVETSKNFKKIKKFSKFQKCPKSFPKLSKRVLNVFWGNFFEKILPSFPWKVESSKIFKKIKKFSKFQKLSKYQKCPKNRSQKYPNVF